jgi:hypothetical protein
MTGLDGPTTTHERERQQTVEANGDNDNQESPMTCESSRSKAAEAKKTKLSTTSDSSHHVQRRSWLSILDRASESAPTMVVQH